MRKIIILAVAVLILTSCDKPKQIGSSQKENNLIPVLVEELNKRDLEKYIQFTGKLEGITDITMVSETSGKVDTISKQLGDWVNKGETIGKVDAEEYKLQVQQAIASLNSAEANLENAELQLKTSKTLFESNSISKTELNQVQSQFKLVLASLQSAQVQKIKAEKALQNAKFTAPVSGYITDFNLEVGEYVQIGKPVAHIVNTESFIIRTGISEEYISNIEKDQKVILQRDNDNNQFYGKISGKGKKPIAGTNSFPVEIILENPNDLYPGMIVTGKILSKTFKNIFYTSINNVVQEYDSHFVYVIDENNIAHKRTVELGEEIEVNVIVKKGVQAGEKLVVEGIANLEEGTKVEIRN